MIPLPIRLAAILLGSGAPSAAAKPNIVVIVSDDCGYNEFSLHGTKLYPTPRIDSIAANGVNFTNGYVSGSVCSPSRAGLLTGRYQQRFGHEHNIPPVYSEVNGLALAETLLPQVLQPAGYRSIARLDALLRDREPVKEEFTYMTDELGRAAAEYIHNNKDRPFFMYLCFNATHTPIQTLESDLQGINDAKPLRKKLRAMSAALDRAVGVVLDGLKQDGVLDNTLVVFINDNGGASGHDNAPLRGMKGSCWEGGIRVAYAMQWPAVLPKGTTYDFPVISLDIFPTAMAAAGVDHSSGKPLDGVNLTPYLTGKTAGRPHQTLYWKSGASGAVRDGDLKLVLGSQKGASPELFDLAGDKAETTNLATERAADVQRLQQLFSAWKKDFPAPLWGPGAEPAASMATD